MHAFVDLLYVRKENASRENYVWMAEDIQAWTGPALAVELLYRHVVFLRWRHDPEVLALNRFLASRPRAS